MVFDKKNTLPKRQGSAVEGQQIPGYPETLKDIHTPESGLERLGELTRSEGARYKTEKKKASLRRTSLHPDRGERCRPTYPLGQWARWPELESEVHWAGQPAGRRSEAELLVPIFQVKTPVRGTPSKHSATGISTVLDLQLTEKRTHLTRSVRTSDSSDPDHLFATNPNKTPLGPVLGYLPIAGNFGQREKAAKGGKDWS